MNDKDLLLEMLKQNKPLEVMAQKQKEPLTKMLMKTFFNSLIIFIAFAMLALPVLIIRMQAETPVLIMALLVSFITSINALDAITTLKQDVEKGLV